MILKHRGLISILILLVITYFAFACPRKAFGQPGSDDTKGTGLKIWPSQPPVDIPFEASKELTGIAFTGRHAQYGHADTWYPSWAADGNLYSPWTDGEVNGVNSGSGGAKATTGYATILGNDPMNLKITDVATYPSNPAPYEGRYPDASLVYRGVWYYGTYCLHQTPEKHLNWDVLGPFVGFRYSTDYGKTWHQTRHTPDHPLFSEPDHFGGKVKMGVPHVVDFGHRVEIGGLRISNGDLLHGDLHGVHMIPREAAGRVAALAAQVRREDRELFELTERKDFSAATLSAKLAEVMKRNL